MSDKENKQSKDKSSKSEKPETAYQTVRIFDSFEEQEKEEIKWLASQTPRQHLQHANELIKRIFAEDLKAHPTLGTEFHIEE